ncbi:MAG: DegT/DnrJ/EryC1/StrS family aminotransferase, partial [Myxococcota bacterium]
AQAIDATALDTCAVHAPTLHRAGSVGDIACLSFYPTKNLAALGEAGMVLTSDAGHATRLRAIRNQGSIEPGLYREIGGNFRMDEMQAALLNVKLSHLSVWTERRQQLAHRYDHALAEHPSLQAPASVWGPGHHVYHQYVVRIGRRRDQVQKALAARGIETKRYYSRPLHHQPCFGDLNVDAMCFEHARAAAEHCLALPIYPRLTEAHQDRVIEALIDEASS